MKCISEKEISDWLQKNRIPEDPYLQESELQYHLQFYAPQYHGQLDAFARCYFNGMIPDGTSLIHITDWALYQPSEMLTIEALRRSCSEEHQLIETPGHIVDASEVEFGIALFSLSASYSWKTYLYTSRSQNILYNWEGEIFDFWAANDSAMTEMQELVKYFDLAEVPEDD